MKKILVVDDNQDDSYTIKEILKKEGHKVWIASNDMEVLDLLKNNKFDLIAIDILMPILSGYDVLKLLRKKLDYKAKMIYISIVPEEEANMNGIDGFIQKPFTPKSLVSGVKKALC